MAEEIHRALAKESYDVIIASQYGMTNYVDYFGGTSALFEELELGQFLGQRSYSALQSMRLNLMKKKLALHIRKVLPHYQGVTVVSEKEAALVKTMIPDYQGKLEIIPNGVDCAENQPLYSRRERVGLI